MSTRRLLLVGALLLAGIACIMQQPTKAYWQSRGSNYNQNVVSGGGGGYTGPGDVVASAKAWWGLRCYNTAYTGNVADVYAPADTTHTLLTCSAGGTINETLQALATTCAISCTVKTLYDQSGAASCSAAACDVSNATIAARPTLTISCQGGHPCLVFARATSLQLTNATGMTQSQPMNISTVAIRTGSNTSYSGIYATGQTGAPQIAFSGSANTFECYSGTGLDGTAADASWHAVQVQINGASSSLFIDGSTTSGDCGAGTVLGTPIAIGTENFGDHLDGKVAEVGLWASNFSGPNQIAMNSNQHTYWGF